MEPLYHIRLAAWRGAVVLFFQAGLWPLIGPPWCGCWACWNGSRPVCKEGVTERKCTIDLRWDFWSVDDTLELCGSLLLSSVHIDHLRRNGHLLYHMLDDPAVEGAWETALQIWCLIRLLQMQWCWYHTMWLFFNDFFFHYKPWSALDYIIGIYISMFVQHVIFSTSSCPALNVFGPPRGDSLSHLHRFIARHAPGDGVCRWCRLHFIDGETEALDRLLP